MPSGRTGSGSFEELEDGFEIDQYVKALGESSSRVRLVMLAIIIASVAASATMLSERQHAWELSRLQEFGQDYALVTTSGGWACPEHVESICGLCGADVQLVGDPTPATHAFPACSLSPSFCLHNDEADDKYAEKNKDAHKLGQLCDAVARLNGRGIVSNPGAENFAEKQWEAFINNVTYVRSPVLGFVFDINDLGLLTGATFFILMVVMFFYCNRAHESLALSMWKVRGIVKKESCYDDPGSKANLLYHALAMQQVFTVPPTLARWNDSGLFRKSHYLLFLLPTLVQFMVLVNDWQSRGKGFEVSPTQTWISLGLQAFFLFAVLAIALACVAHLHADDRLWEDVFLYINPRHKLMAKPLWRHWLKIADDHPPAWGLAVRPSGKAKEWREVLFLDSIHGSLLQVRLRAERNLNVFPVSGVREVKRTWARGLYLDPAGEERLYSKARAARRFPAVSGRSRLLPVQDAGLGGEAETEILPDLVPGPGKLYLSKRRLTKFGPEGCGLVWSLGGMPYQADGSGRRSGLAALHSIIPDGDSLFVTDGGWVRRIEPDGRISTWGGRPLGGYLRPERSFLLGLALVPEGSVFNAQERCRTAGVSPKLLVCDFTLRRVFGVDEDRVWELYRSDRGWAPTGIAVDGDAVYLLEYRSDTAIGEWINYALKTCWPRLWTRSLLSFWRYLRVLRFDHLSFDDPSVVVELSSFDWRRASAAGIAPRSGAVPQPGSVPCVPCGRITE